MNITKRKQGGLVYFSYSKGYGVGKWPIGWTYKKQSFEPKDFEELKKEEEKTEKDSALKVQSQTANEDTEDKKMDQKNQKGFGGEIDPFDIEKIDFSTSSESSEDEEEIPEKRKKIESSFVFM